MGRKNTHPYQLFSHSCSYIFCWGHLYRQLIDWIFIRIFVVSFLPARTLMHIRLLLSPVQMPSFMYLIFSKKQRIKFFDPPGGWVWAKFFFKLIDISFFKSLGPFSRAWVTELVFAASAFTRGRGLFFDLFGAF